MADVSRSPSGSVISRGGSNGGPLSLPNYPYTSSTPPRQPHHIRTYPTRSASERYLDTDDDDYFPPTAGPPSLISNGDWPRTGPSSLPSLSERSPRSSSRLRGSPVRPASSNEGLSQVPSPKSSPSPSASRDRSPPAHRSLPSTSASISHDTSLRTHTKGFYSSASVENARYRLNQSPIPDHDNEDRHFSIDKGNYQVFGVFDGHDGPRAVEFAVKRMTEFFGMQSWETVMKGEDSALVTTCLEEFFKTTEKEFFDYISHDVGFKEAISACIPKVSNKFRM